MTTRQPDDPTTRLILDFITAACHALAWQYEGMPTVQPTPGGNMQAQPQPEGTFTTTLAFSMLQTAVIKAQEQGYPAPNIISPIPSNGWTIDLSQLPPIQIRQLPPSEIELTPDPHSNK